MLTFDNVRFQYDSEDFSIIDHLSFTVDAGEFVCVIGTFRMWKKYNLPTGEQASDTGRGNGTGEWNSH